MLPATPARPEYSARPEASTAASATAHVGGLAELVGQTAAQATREWASRGPSARADVTLAAAAPAFGSGFVALLADMHAAVTTYVGRRRGEGTPVQRVLPEVKALVRGAVSGAEMREAAELLVAHAVRWSIEAYYSTDDASHAASQVA